MNKWGRKDQFLSEKFQVTYADIPPLRRAQLPSPKGWAAHNDFIAKCAVLGGGEELYSGETWQIRPQPGDHV